MFENDGTSLSGDDKNGCNKSMDLQNNIIEGYDAAT